MSGVSPFRPGCRHESASRSTGVVAQLEHPNIAKLLDETGQEDQARALLAEFGDAALACGHLTPLPRRLVLTTRADLGP